MQAALQRLPAVPNGSKTNVGGKFGRCKLRAVELKLLVFISSSNGGSVCGSFPIVVVVGSPIWITIFAECDFYFHRWVMQKTKTWLERMNTTKQRKRRVLLPGNTSTNNPGGGSNRKTRANGLAKTKNSGLQVVMAKPEESKVLRLVIQ